MSQLSGHDACMASMAALNASMDTGFNEIIRLLRQQQGLPPAPPPFPLAALPASPAAQKPSAPLAAPPAPKPYAQTTPPELPPQLIPTPIPARSYPPSPSVDTIEEVEQKQVYKPLRNVKQMRQKHGASRRMRRIRDAEFFENCIAWPPKFGGTHMRFSRDEEPDAWYTTMLNHRQKLIEALPNVA